MGNPFEVLNDLDPTGDTLKVSGSSSERPGFLICKVPKPPGCEDCGHDITVLNHPDAWIQAFGRICQNCHHFRTEERISIESGGDRALACYVAELVYSQNDDAYRFALYGSDDEYDMY